MLLFCHKVHPFPLHLACCVFCCCYCFCFERVSSCVKSSQCQYSRSNGDDDFCRDQAALIVRLPIRHLRHLILLTALKAHTAPFRLLHSEFKWFSLLRKKALVMCRFNHTNPLFLCVFQSSAAAPGSLPAAVGRCSVSRCPGSVTAGQRVRTRVTRWTVPVSTAHLSPFTPSLLPNTHNMIDFWKD